ATDVANLWTALMASRSPDTGVGGANVPGANSNPFWGLGTGLAAGGDALSAGPRGVNSTLLRASSATTTWTDQVPLRLFEPSSSAALTQAPQPLGRFEMLSKIMGNLTTRSNVFGVWVTFGFFTVTNSTTQPVQLGAEYVWPSVG